MVCGHASQIRIYFSYLVGIADVVQRRKTSSLTVYCVLAELSVKSAAHNELSAELPSTSNLFLLRHSQSRVPTGLINIACNYII